MEQLTQFVKPELLILVPVLYLLGEGLKKSTVKDKYIPLLVGAAGVLLSLIYVLSTEDIGGVLPLLGGVFTAVTQGILAAGGSVYCNQIIKQLHKGE